ncbi:MAG: hypothetical protein ACLQDL_00750 [Spirochaetia bacterium]
MKRAGIILAACLLLISGLPLFAQASAGTTTGTTAGTTASATAGSSTNPTPKDAYYKSIPLIKVWAHQLGYMVQFWTSKSQVASIYIPLTWFNLGPNSKADIIYGNEPTYPRLVIFWVDGKFDHVNLYVLDNFDSLTWGVLNQAGDYTTQFNVEEVPKDF